jgi:predicted RNA-binding protein YlqC (UPF0109 family)
LEQDAIGDLVRRIAQAVVDSPELVRVEAIAQNGSIAYRVQVPRDEVGQLIGKQGRTARSLRTILAAISMKEKRRIELDIVA